MTTCLLTLNPNLLTSTSVPPTACPLVPAGLPSNHGSTSAPNSTWLPFIAYWWLRTRLPLVLCLLGAHLYTWLGVRLNTRPCARATRRYPRPCRCVAGSALNLVFSPSSPSVVRLRMLFIHPSLSSDLSLPPLCCNWKCCTGGAFSSSMVARVLPAVSTNRATEIKHLISTTEGTGGGTRAVRIRGGDQVSTGPCIPKLGSLGTLHQTDIVATKNLGRCCTELMVGASKSSIPSRST